MNRRINRQDRIDYLREYWSDLTIEQIETYVDSNKPAHFENVHFFNEALLNAARAYKQIFQKFISFITKGKWT